MDVHKMGPDLAAVCGSDSYDLAASWGTVTCKDCLARREALAS